jgi:signal transduction histidine kinase/ActR/RegA family two-component response regulator
MDKFGENGRVNILMVDDQPAKLLSYEAILSDLGENLIRAESAREALDQMLRSEIAVVLLDVSMPELDGFELAAMIRQHPRFEKTAIIFISAILQTEFDRLRGYESGAVDYIPVPVVPELLRAKVRVFVDLYRKTRQLEQINVNLEQRVASRTAELEASTARLRENEEKLQKLLAQEIEARAEAEAARAEAQAASRAKDEFLAVISHELRTPLNAILGWSSIVKGHPDPTLVARAIDTIERNGKQQLRLIEDLMDMARIVGGKLQLKVEIVELTGIVFAAFETVRAAAAAKRIVLQPQFTADPVWVAADPGRLQQVVWNLLTNAVKFTDEGGSVTVEIKHEGTTACLMVRDTGIGIDSEFLPYVFDRFSQADSSAARRFGGLGLGLALVRQVVEMHGGTASVASAGAGTGTTFTVCLPSAAVEAALARRPERVHFEELRVTEQIGGVRVLIVDDERDALDFLALSLGSHGANVRTSGSARDALRQIASTPESEPFDILIADIGMPEMDGYELLREIRGKAQSGTASMPVVALTAYTRPEDRAQILAAGFQAHLAKPVDVEELVVLIRTLVVDLGKRAIT